MQMAAVNYRAALLKVHGHVYRNEVFYISFEESSLKRCRFKILGEI